MKEEDRDLRELFRKLRQEDQQSAPSFRKIWTTSVSRQSHPRPLLRFAVAVSVFLLFGLSIYLVERAMIQTAPQTAPVYTFSEWKAPTDFLLQTPGRELLQSAPAFGRSLPGKSIQESGGIQP